MDYKGTYSGSTGYSIGDVVVYTDGVAYEKFAAAGTGVTPHNVRVWRRVPQPAQDMVSLFHSMLAGLKSANQADANSITSLQKMIAPAYSKTTYAEHALVTKDGKLYYAKAAIETAENWTAAHWQETTVGAEITALQPEE